MIEVVKLLFKKENVPNSRVLSNVVSLRAMKVGKFVQKFEIPVFIALNYSLCLTGHAEYVVVIKLHT
jgi:hypothetical protein